MSTVQELETFSTLAPSVAKTPFGVGAPSQGFALAKALLRGLHIQLLSTGEMHFNTVGVEVAEEEHDFQEMLLDEWSTYQDDVTGIPLDSRLVQAARAEELSEISKGAYIQKYLQLTAGM